MFLIFSGVGWGRVSWGGVGWGGVSSSFVGGFVLGVLGVAFVGDLGDVSVVIIGGVGDGLSAAIGEKDHVGSGDNFAVAAFLLAVIVVGVVILDGIGEVVWHRSLNSRQQIPE